MTENVEIVIKRADPNFRPVTVKFDDRTTRRTKGRSKSFTIWIHKDTSIRQVVEKAQSLLEGIQQQS